MTDGPRGNNGAYSLQSVQVSEAKLAILILTNLQLFGDKYPGVHFEKNRKETVNKLVEIF